MDIFGGINTTGGSRRISEIVGTNPIEYALYNPTNKRRKLRNAKTSFCGKKESFCDENAVDYKESRFKEMLKFDTNQQHKQFWRDKPKEVKKKMKIPRQREKKRNLLL